MVKVVFFRGRNRQEARKKALGYWFANRSQFTCTMSDFIRKCSTDPTGRVIVYKEN